MRKVGCETPRRLGMLTWSPCSDGVARGLPFADGQKRSQRSCAPLSLFFLWNWRNVFSLPWFALPGYPLRSGDGLDIRAVVLTVHVVNRIRSIAVASEVHEGVAPLQHDGPYSTATTEKAFNVLLTTSSRKTANENAIPGHFALKISDFR